MATWLLSIAAAAAVVTTHAAVAQTAAAHPPIVLTGADRRPAISLDGDWAAIVDPYFSGLFSFHRQERTDGFFLNRKAQAGDNFPTEYDFATAPKPAGEEAPAEESMLEYTEYVDPKYAEKIMAESLSLAEEPAAASPRKGPASETAEPAAEPLATESGV